MGEKGEALLRGPNVFNGYWRNEQATKEAFADGWLRTGDYVVVNEEGLFHIVDRKKVCPSLFYPVPYGVKYSVGSLTGGFYAVGNDQSERLPSSAVGTRKPPPRIARCSRLRRCGRQAVCLVYSCLLSHLHHGPLSSSQSISQSLSHSPLPHHLKPSPPPSHHPKH